MDAAPAATGKRASPVARSALMMMMLQVRPGSSNTVIQSSVVAVAMICGSWVNSCNAHGAIDAVITAIKIDTTRPMSRHLRTSRWACRSCPAPTKWPTKISPEKPMATVNSTITFMICIV